MADSASAKPNITIITKETDMFPGASLQIQSVRTVSKRMTQNEQGQKTLLGSTLVSYQAQPEPGDFQIKGTKTKTLINSPQTTSFLRIQGEPETKVAIKDSSLNLLPALRVLSI